MMPDSKPLSSSKCSAIASGKFFCAPAAIPPGCCVSIHDKAMEP